MAFAVLLLILMSVYVMTNPRMEQSSKTGYCAVVGFIIIAYIIFGIIL